MSVPVVRVSTAHSARRPPSMPSVALVQPVSRVPNAKPTLTNAPLIPVNSARVKTSVPPSSVYAILFTRVRRVTRKLTSVNRRRVQMEPAARTKIVDSSANVPKATPTHSARQTLTSVNLRRVNTAECVMMLWMPLCVSALRVSLVVSVKRTWTSVRRNHAAQALPSRAWICPATSNASVGRVWRRAVTTVTRSVCRIPVPMVVHVPISCWVLIAPALPAFLVMTARPTPTSVHRVRVSMPRLVTISPTALCVSVLPVLQEPIVRVISTSVPRIPASTGAHVSTQLCQAYLRATARPVSVALYAT